MEFNKRRKKCEIRVSASEKEKIQALAAEYGLSISATIRHILIQEHFLSKNHELNSLFGQIRDTLSAISQSLNILIYSNSNNLIVRQLQDDIQELKKTIVMMEKKL